MIRVGVIGGAGYTAGELLRLLVNHPEVEVRFIQSGSSVGRLVTDVHRGLDGDIDLTFCEDGDLSGVDCLFLCSAHGQSSEWMASHKIPETLCVIDLAQDFRDEHDGFVYGLPEWQRDRIAKSNRIANPGCFATAIQLSLLPLAVAGRLCDDIHVTALTGSTGAGVKPTETTHFSWRTDNISVYKAFEHQHLLEINRNIHCLQPSFDGAVRFVPMRGDFARGIFASVYMTTRLALDEATALYKGYYSNASFTHVVDKSIDLKQVVNTNKALVHVAKYDDILHITTVIDNLLKGASGQAVQNMNIRFGLDENCGLKLKATAF